jgi:hypothetical protein
MAIPFHHALPALGSVTREGAIKNMQCLNNTAHMAGLPEIIRIDIKPFHHLLKSLAIQPALPGRLGDISVG